jgi:hypothetical protein
LGLAFKKCAASSEKFPFFQKEARKSKTQNSAQVEKNYFGKKFYHEVLISNRRINFQKISQFGDCHWFHCRFLQKTASKSGPKSVFLASPDDLSPKWHILV